jgi:hypothetical protein
MRDRYDGTVGTIQLATMEGGRAVRACAKTLKAQ